MRVVPTQRRRARSGHFAPAPTARCASPRSASTPAMAVRAVSLDDDPRVALLCCAHACCNTLAIVHHTGSAKCVLRITEQQAFSMICLKSGLGPYPGGITLSVWMHQWSVNKMRLCFRRLGQGSRLAEADQGEVPQHQLGRPHAARLRDVSRGAVSNPPHSSGG